jgi:hypothetical protein
MIAFHAHISDMHTTTIATHIRLLNAYSHLTVISVILVSVCPEESSRVSVMLHVNWLGTLTPVVSTSKDEAGPTVTLTDTAVEFLAAAPGHSRLQE